MIDKVSDGYDAVIVSVAHDEYKAFDEVYLKDIMKDEPILIDSKGMYDNLKDRFSYWRF